MGSSATEPLAVCDFVDRLPSEQRHDALELCALFTEVTGHDPVMWGPSIVGFGKKELRQNSEVADDGLELGFAPRNGKTVLYLRRYTDFYADFLPRLGKVLVGKACISFASLDDVDRGALRDLLQFAWNNRTRAA